MVAASSAKRTLIYPTIPLAPVIRIMGDMGRKCLKRLCILGKRKATSKNYRHRGKLRRFRVFVTTDRALVVTGTFRSMVVVRPNVVEVGSAENVVPAIFG